MLMIALWCVSMGFSCSMSRVQTPSDIVRSSITDYTQSMECMTPEFLVAPVLCRAPVSGARMSRAGKGTEHGEKFYHLYVNDPGGYVATVMGEQDAPVGLTLVKESHYAKVVGVEAHGPTGTRAVRRPDGVSDLFVMMKIGEPDTPDTDMGWIYATASPLGEIESIGMIESCIRCHRDADHDRLFGIAP